MFAVGTVINGKYRLERQIGEGGMATVWRAVQFPLDRPVALKFVHTAGPRRGDMTEQFLKEARALAAVRHRNVVDVIDFGVSEDDQPFMVMEFLEGQTLARVLKEKSILPLAEIGPIMVSILGGLAAVHDAGIIHRDVKPDNIFLIQDSDGLIIPKLLDFGVARVLDRSLGPNFSAIPTVDGLIVGTPQYMSPEQARAIPGVDHRTDIYSVGVILYQALSGQLPFDAEHAGDVIAMIATRRAAAFASLRSDLGPDVCGLIDRAMSRAPKDRYPDAKAMREALQQAMNRHASGDEASVGDSTESGALQYSQRPTMARTLEVQKRPAVFNDFEESSVPTDPSIVRFRRSRKMRAVLFWLVPLALIAGGVVVMFRTQKFDLPGANVEAKDAVQDMRVDAAAPTRVENQPVETPKPGELKDATVTVELHGVPANAQVLIDGLPVPKGPIEFPKESRVRVIEVRERGMRPWRAEFTPDSSQTLEVKLEPEVRERTGHRPKHKTQAKHTIDKQERTQAEPEATSTKPRSIFDKLGR